MNRQTISLGRILGIPIGVDYSWFLVFALLTWTLATSYFPAEFSRWPTALYWIVGAVTAILMFASVLLHELGHSVVAMRYKIPVRNITLFIFGGVAQIASEPPSARAELWIAIAGPAVSFALAIFFGLLQPFVGAFAPLLALAKYLAYINGSLALFNLIPGFPLDGGRVFRAIIWGITRNLRRATIIAANVGRFIAFLFILFGVWQIFIGNFGNGLWIAFIGWFLQSAASSQVQQQAIHDVLAGHSVQQAMSRSYAFIPAEMTLQQLVDYHILGNGQRSFVVKEGSRPIGLLTLRQIRAVPQSAWPTTAVGQVMLPIKQLEETRPDQDLWDALEEMDRDGVSQLPVVADRQVLGVLRREDIMGYLRTLHEFGA
jgi:Zn-dependent protease/CBS domain-containing protein